MTRGITTPANLERFRTAVARWLGLQFDDARVAVLDETLRARVAANGGDAGLYLTALLSEVCPRRELGAMAEMLTVTETYFFRNAEQLDAFADVALPERMAARSAGGRVNVLSIGCASGEEPFSLAMAVRETVPGDADAVQIRGVDVNPAMLARARGASYSEWALRNTTAARRMRWFQPNGARFSLDPSVRNAVQFGDGNLALDDAELWQPETYDVVFCRNVLMYFGAAAARAAVARIESALVPGGFLFLGHAETLRGLSDAFHLCHTHDTFYYRRRSERSEVATFDGAREQLTEPATARSMAYDGSPAAQAGDAAWVETIRLASERVEALALGADEFVHLRELERDELSPGAQYLLALRREGEGDVIRARAHDEAAIYLDSSFSMAHLHLGLLERRAGSHDAARRILSAALTALHADDSSRLLLFGGGFSREALIALCRTALATCRGAA